MRRFAELEGKRIAAIARAHWIDDALVGQAASAGPTPMPPERRESMTMATATATATPPRTAKRGCDQRRGDRRQRGSTFRASGRRAKPLTWVVGGWTLASGFPASLRVMGGNGVTL